MEEEYEERKLQVAKTRELEKQLEDLKGQAAFRDKGNGMAVVWKQLEEFSEIMVINGMAVWGGGGGGGG